MYAIRSYYAAFRGFSLYRERIDIRGEVCELCTNHCKISVADVSGTEVAYGFLCGRDYGTKNYVSADTSGFDLLRERSRATNFVRKTEESEFRIRITSYNVCYTKLLRNFRLLRWRSTW